MPALQKIKMPLPVPPAARKTHNKIFERLTVLSGSTACSCREPDFKRTWKETLDLIDRYQQEITSASRLTISCDERCTACCCHWVEDVNSFEAELIAEHLKRVFPEKIRLIIEQCGRDEKTLTKLNAIVEAKLGDFNSRGLLNSADPVDLLLASFYRMQIPCPLLDGKLCIAYPVRPLTCRMYVSFSAPPHCRPDTIDESEVPTYLFDLDEEADAIIDRLHFKFLKFENDTGLRSLLAKYLRRL
jgi:Fe-S-cluster containining protein